MPKITNFDQQEVIDLETITARVEENFPELVSENKGIRKTLDDAGVSVEAITNKLSLIFQNSEDKIAHDISKTLLQMHGVLKDDKNAGTSINLVIQSEDTKVMSILNPSR